MDVNTYETSDPDEDPTIASDAETSPLSDPDLDDSSATSSEPTETVPAPPDTTDTESDPDTRTDSTTEPEPRSEPPDIEETVEEETVEEPVCFPDNNWESCDQRDNNCDGNIDEGFVCPGEPGVVGALPFEGGVYLVGTTAKGQASATALQRFWPSIDPSYINGFGNYDDDFSVRRSDSQLFFADLDGVIGRIDGPVPIPECLQFAISRYGFDANDTLYYVCRGDLLRGEAEPLVYGVDKLLGVTDDGRAVVEHGSDGLGHWAADTGFGPMDLQIFGSLYYMASSVQGNTVVAAFARQLDETDVIVLKFDEDSQWSVMRRLAIDPTSSTWAVLVDGTLMSNQVDPEDSNFRRIVALLPDGTEQVAWREAESPEVLNHGSTDMFTGPLDPAVLDGP